MAYYLVARSLFDADMMDYLKAKIVQSGGIMHDREITSQELADDEAKAEQVMARMLETLRGIK